MNREPTLVVLAAGMGSRYGGSKQTDPVGPRGEVLMDYSIYDAARAGFGRVVFLIKPEMKDAFDASVGRRLRGKLDTAYAFQTPEAHLPAGAAFPAGRKKPWGTAHAVLCCRDAVDGPFAMVNADDYYGPHGFAQMYGFLKDADPAASPMDFAMVGFRLGNTLTENGSVARGICSVKDGFLTGVTERTRIARGEDGPRYCGEDGGWAALPEDAVASMNFWGFTPQIFGELERRFPAFLEKEAAADPLNAEMYIPTVVGGLLAEGRARVRVMSSRDRWYGVTYRQDKPAVVKAIADMTARGLYPESLWD